MSRSHQGIPAVPQPDVANIVTVTGESPGATIGPEMFDQNLPAEDPTTVLNEPIKRAWTEGGVIENVKRAVVTGLREAFNGTTIGDPIDGQKFNIDIEYPRSPQELPHIWVQFSISKLNRGGLDMGVMTKDSNGNWGEIRTWIFDGKITLTCAAESSLDRDRLADTVISNLAFARAPDLVIRNPQTNTQQNLGLISALNNNSYVSMTLNTDEILSGGQQVTNSIPWKTNELLYEDNYTVACHGQFNMRFAHDGLYELAEIDINPNIMARGPDYNPMNWLGAPNQRVR